jgi:HEAT repeat protein
MGAGIPCHQVGNVFSAEKTSFGKGAKPMFGDKMGKVAKAIEKQNTKALIDLANTRDTELRIAAIAGLGRVGGDDSANYLITQLGNTEPQIRIAVAEALGVMGDMHTKAHVSAQLNKETDPQVREAISKAMKNIKGY